MDVFEALFTRRSIRKFTTQFVSKDDENLILKAAMLAPSACNEQPWHFVCVRDAEMRERLSHVSPYTHMAAEAPLVIVVCGDLALEKAKGMWVQDCSAAIENILLAARGKSLGSVWCGIHPEKEREAKTREVLGIPENVIPLAVISIGHPAQHFSEASRFIQERIHRDKW